MPESDPTRSAKPQPRIGSYQLLNSLGSGGMSSVFKAMHVETGHVVAVKVLPRALAKNVTLLQRFLREAKSAEALEHPNIVSIYDRGVDQGRYYLVLEYVEGGDLHDRVRNGGPLGVGEATAVIRAVAKGLQFAATRGLIHRDIKPANILMTDAGLVKIIDLGLALQSENEDERVTREGTTVGTVDYMAPEQARDSRATSERSDMYSLGCTYYFILTGMPPFPGGDVADKLSRHCLKPAPDPRQLRAEIPAPLALLIQRMMAKRPENRFVDYEELIDELDAVPTGAEPSAEPALFALIDEEDEVEPAPAAPAAVEPLYAIVDDDDDEPGGGESSPVLSQDLRLLAPDAPKQPVSSRDVRPSLADVSLAELAALTGEPARAVPSRPSAPPTRREPPEIVNPLASILADEHADDGGEEPAHALGPRIAYESTKKLVLTYVVVGLVLVLLIIGSHQLIRLSTAKPEFSTELTDVEPAPEPPPPPPEISPPESRPASRPAPPAPRPPAAVASRTPVIEKKATPPAPAPAPAMWVEPTDPAPPPLPADNPRAVGSEFLPEWARSPVADPIVTRTVTVRRAIDPRDSNQRASLGAALETLGTTVELAGNGPFFENDLRIHGESRLLRARPGFRPIVVADPPQLDIVREQPAVVVLLEGKKVVLDGLDLVVNVQGLPPNQTAFFECRGGSLTLRRCSVTIVNPRGTPFDVIRTRPSGRPSRVRLEQTLVRGTSCTPLHLEAGASEVVLNRSVVLGGRGPLVAARSPEPGRDARLYLVQSLLCGRGSVLDVGAPAPGKSAGPLTVKAYGSTFASLAGESPASFVDAPREDDRITELLRWTGDDNLFAGWREWAASGAGRMANLTAARAAWTGTDAHSVEDASRWNVTTDLERVSPAELAALVPQARAFAAWTAAPSPYLLQKTVEHFVRFKVPPLATTASPPPTPPPNPSAAAPASAKAGSERVRSEVLDLTFDVKALPWQGDLGRFVHDELKGDSARVRVVVKGTGSFTCSPIRLPEGVSLEVRAESTPAPGAATVSWSAPAGASAEALIDVRGGEVVLCDVRLRRDASARMKFLVRVERGHLVLNRCWLTAPGAVEKGGGNLVAFESPGTQPLTTRPTVFQTVPDRPVCFVSDSLFITGGDAVTTELGRGVLELSQCAIAAGNAAFVLRPARVARSRLEAGLRLEHCTVASERTFVHLGPWRGTDPGPDRPWVVSTKDTAFVSSFDPPAVARECVLLRVEADSLAHGALFWQSTNDAFEVPHFVASSDATVAQDRRDDVQRNWVQLWGEAHMHSVTGPTSGRATASSAPSVRFPSRLTAGHVAPADLELDPDHHPGRTILSVGADLARLGIKTARRPRR